MISKKLAALVATAVMLGQVSQIPILFAQADTQVANSQTSPDNSIQVASVIQRPADVEDPSQSLLSPGSLESTPPDVYTIEVGEGKLPIIIQALPEDEENASLYVNGLEVMHFRGTFEELSPEARVKAAAKQLNSVLLSDLESAAKIEPALAEGKPVIRIDEQVITLVDESTAKGAKLDANRLAFLWANRLRQALGEQHLQTQDYPAFNPQPQPRYIGTGQTQVGEASWYGPGFHGRRTASGARYNMYAMTAAHRRLPFGTLVRVTNRRNNRSCIVKITDRGPFAHGRIIDLSKSAAQAIGMSGVAKVTLEVVKGG